METMNFCQICLFLWSFLVLNGMLRQPHDTSNWVLRIYSHPYSWVCISNYGLSFRGLDGPLVEMPSLSCECNPIHLFIQETTKNRNYQFNYDTTLRSTRLKAFAFLLICEVRCFWPTSRVSNFVHLIVNIYKLVSSFLIIYLISSPTFIDILMRIQFINVNSFIRCVYTPSPCLCCLDIIPIVI